MSTRIIRWPSDQLCRGPWPGGPWSGRPARGRHRRYPCRQRQGGRGVLCVQQRLDVADELARWDMAGEHGCGAGCQRLGNVALLLDLDDHQHLGRERSRRRARSAPVTDGNRLCTIIRSGWSATITAIASAPSCSTMGTARPAATSARLTLPQNQSCRCTTTVLGRGLRVCWPSNTRSCSSSRASSAACSRPRCSLARARSRCASRDGRSCGSGPAGASAAQAANPASWRSNKPAFQADADAVGPGVAAAATRPAVTSCP